MAEHTYVTLLHRRPWALYEIQCG